MLLVFAIKHVKMRHNIYVICFMYEIVIIIILYIGWVSLFSFIGVSLGKILAGVFNQLPLHLTSKKQFVLIDKLIDTEKYASKKYIFFSVTD